jgi:hypothetical protein
MNYEPIQNSGFFEKLLNTKYEINLKKLSKNIQPDNTTPITMTINFTHRKRFATKNASCAGLPDMKMGNWP